MENEYLDLRGATGIRWRREVLPRILESPDAYDILERILDCLTRTISGVQRQVPLDALFAARESGAEAVREVVRQARPHDYMLLFLRLSEANPGLGRHDFARKYVSFALRRYLDQMAYSAAGKATCGGLGAMKARCDQWFARAMAGVSRIAHSLADKPSRSVRARRSAGRTRGASVLQVSLVG